MNCTSPIYLEKEDIKVPCGRCLDCKIQRSREWTVRIMNEAEYHKGSLFVTLTFDEDSINERRSIDLKELQDYVKRLRDRVYPRKIKFFGCGEYGEDKGRPHYHLIIFGIELEEHQLKKVKNGWHLLSGPCKDAWKFGIVHADDVVYNSARYVLDYMLKEPPQRIVQGLTKPFQTMSRGIGKQYALDKEEKIKKDLGIRYQGKDVGLPKYYVRVLDIDTKKIKEVGRQKFIENNKWLERFKDDERVYKEVVRNAFQLERNRLAQRRIKSDKKHIRGIR